MYRIAIKVSFSSKILMLINQQQRLLMQYVISAVHPNCYCLTQACVIALLEAETPINQDLLDCFSDQLWAEQKLLEVNASGV